MTTDERFAVLSALVDREPVGPEELAAALEEPEGRARLVDFVRLRALAAAALDEDDVQVPSRRARATPLRGSLMKRAAMVLLPVALTVGGALLYDQWKEIRPPAPDRIVEFTPGVDWQPAEIAMPGGDQ